MLAYLKAFAAEAKGKATTYFALALSGLAVLPEVLPQYWGQVESLIPTAVNKETVHHLLLGVGSLAVIYLRVRREVKPNAPTS
jgi:hypothetical protein